MQIVQKFSLCVASTIFVFIVCFFIGENVHKADRGCAKRDVSSHYVYTIPTLDDIHIPLIEKLNGNKFQEHYNQQFADLHFPWNTLLVDNHHSSKNCRKISNIFVDMNTNLSCLAIVSATTSHSHNLARFRDPTINSFYALTQGLQTGFFIRPGNSKGRVRFVEKMDPLIRHLKEITNTISKMLLKRNLLPGADIVVMVVNDGEMDLFINFACSCLLHDINMNNMLVFAGSKEIVPLISSTGAMGLYSEYFASVDKDASKVYLDATFVDMMWYKAFSVWTVLQMGYHALFQDIDIVWFRQPDSYFNNIFAEFFKKTGVQPTGFFSDDGQRGTIRFAPFFFNSGFYYILSSPLNVNIVWNIMLSFDVIQSGGSHQNAFTQRLMEAMDLGGVKPVALHEHDFATGASYHHDPKLMGQIATKQYLPYNFHMCWTADKAQKLKFFKNASMWYIDHRYDLEDFRAEGKFAVPLRSAKGDSFASWASYPPAYCVMSPKSP